MAQPPMMIPLNLQLENDHVLLRALQESDLVHLTPFAEQEQDLWQYSLMPINGVADLQDYMRAALVGRAAGKEFPFIIYNKNLQQYAGSTRFYDIQFQQHSLQIGYTWIGKAHWGSLVNKSCKYLLLAYAFEQLHMERVEFRADVRNMRSRKAMASIGCVEEGILRSHMTLTDGTRRSSVVLSILKSEWERDVKMRLQQHLVAR